MCLLITTLYMKLQWLYWASLDTERICSEWSKDQVFESKELYVGILTAWF